MNTESQDIIENEQLEFIGKDTINNAQSEQRSNARLQEETPHKGVNIINKVRFAMEFARRSLICCRLGDLLPSRYVMVGFLLGSDFLEMFA